MQLKTRGIVLQTTRYSESSLILKLYTESNGLQSFMVNGVRSRNPKFPNALFHHFSLLEIVATGKPGSSLLRITDCRHAPALNNLGVDLMKSSVAMFLSEVVYRSVKEESSNQELFGFLDNAIQILNLENTDCSRFHIYFLVRLSRHLGFSPNGEYLNGVSIFDLREGLFRDDKPSHNEYLSETASEKLYNISNASFENYAEVKIPFPVMKELLKGLVYYYELHQTHGNTIRSHQILEDILS